MPIYDALAAELKQKLEHLRIDEQYWLGIVGVPGSGKSTFVKAMKTRLGDVVTAIPMDGYHYYRHELDAMDDPQYAHARRGAPFTFNAAKCVDDLRNARRQGCGQFPSFDHTVGDPIERDITLHKQSRIVLVEGNYLLLNEHPWQQLVTQVFNESWFLDLPLEESNRRLCKRHMETGLTAQQAQDRVEKYDRLNAEIILKTAPLADKIINMNSPAAPLTLKT